MIPPPLRRKRSSNPARPFLATVAILSALALLSYLAQTSRTQVLGQPASILSRRDEIPPTNGDEAPWADDEACHHVHRYDLKDQCAFVKANCLDEDAGLFSYLTLYYCDLPHAKPVGFFIIATWTAFLFTTIGVAASDFFCINLSTISNYLGMSESMAGVTFLAFGNGSPDVFSTFAAVRSHSGSLAVGELIGAAGFITAVVAGSMALIRPFHVYKKSFVRDIGFFIVAVAFSIVFLANGQLTLWECAVMVGFYLFYVIFVVGWHWILSKRRKKKERLVAARSHYIHGTEADAVEEYRDEPDGESGHSGSRPVSFVILDELERAGYDPDAYEELDDEETRDKWMGELTSNMRVTRPLDRDRTTPFTPIRPSLVGALEFRAVLASLERSRHRHATSLNMRRYSDAPYYTTAQQQQAGSVVSDPEGAQGAYEASIREHEEDQNLLVDGRVGNANRGRAVSANDAASLRLQHQRLNIPPPMFSSLPPENDAIQGHYGTFTTSPANEVPKQPSPNVLITSPPDDYFAATPRPRTATADLLAPPEVRTPSQRSRSQHSSRADNGSKPPRPHLIIPHSARSSPKQSPLNSPLITALSAGSGSRSPTLMLPDLVSPDSIFDNTPKKVAKWWPSKYLPTPMLMARTVFPTLYGWQKKSLWAKFLGILAAPSFFFLAITLPVVEPMEDKHEVHPILPPDSAGVDVNQAAKPPASHPHRLASCSSGVSAGGSRQNEEATAESETLQPVAENPPAPVANSQEWNRWLVLLQCVTAPWFVVVIFWANDSMEPRKLLMPSIYSLVCSLIAIMAVLLTTSASQPPRWHFLLCFVGFAVSITWISTIANEVVGVLKTIGVIFNMSDAILGLTIFAVGNSLGDLVADVTVARLGYPVMALSACFGGPMLNILLGIGLSGLYMTIGSAEKRSHKHPDRPVKFKPYHVQVSTTLLVSAAALMVTLVGLLIAVPLNGWKMDRKIGWGLITLWIVSTIGNVIVEITGIGEDYTR